MTTLIIFAWGGNYSGGKKLQPAWRNICSLMKKIPFRKVDKKGSRSQIMLLKSLYQPSEQNSTGTQLNRSTLHYTRFCTQQHRKMEKLLFEAVSPRINSSKFGLVSAQELFQFELTCSEIYTRADIIQETEFNFNQKLSRYYH